MFRKITNSAPSRQPLQKVEKVDRKQIKGGTIISKSVSFGNPDNRISFDEYSLEDLLNTGVKLEQVDTKVLDNNYYDSVLNVSRETSLQDSHEDQPF